MPGCTKLGGWRHPSDGDACKKVLVIRIRQELWCGSFSSFGGAAPMRAESDHAGMHGPPVAPEGTATACKRCSDQACVQRSSRGVRVVHEQVLHIGFRPVGTGLCGVWYSSATSRARAPCSMLQLDAGAVGWPMGRRLRNWGLPLTCCASAGRRHCNISSDLHGMVGDAGQQALCRLNGPGGPHTPHPHARVPAAWAGPLRPAARLLSAL